MNRIEATAGGIAYHTDFDARTTNSSLRVLVDVNHPAQVHLFRHTIAELQRLGHETFVTSREKEVTVDLLDAFGIDHVALTERGSSTVGLLVELFRRERRLLEVAREFEPDVILGRLGPAPAHVSKMVECAYVVVNDTVIRSRFLRFAYNFVTFPFVDIICVPPTMDLPVAPERRRSLDFQELAYLHPRYFTPDPAVLQECGIDPNDPYYVVRLAGWDAFHDVGHHGLSIDAAVELVSLLDEHGEVFISAERELPRSLAGHRLLVPPEHIHQVLYHADLYVGDSGTMSTEAAMLGTPAIRVNTMVGDDGENVFRELEHRYGLLESYSDEAKVLRVVEAFLRADHGKALWRRRRQKLIDDHPDVTERIVEVILDAGRGGYLRPERRCAIQ